jgi:hypothetical protein
VLGWLSVVIGTAVLVFTYAGGCIAPDSVQRDVIGFSAIVLVLAAGVSLNVLVSSLASRIQLVLARSPCW